MSTVTEIHIAELYVGDASNTIVTNGVGSCIVIVLYDRSQRVGGMAHALLPKGKNFPPAVLARGEQEKYFVKYADLAVDMLVEKLVAKGGVKENFVAKLIGGARMFLLLDGGKFGIGWENAVSAEERLAYHHIPVESKVVGGTVGRNVKFDCSTGVVEIVTKV